jgi:competence protein ComEC
MFNKTSKNFTLYPFAWLAVLFASGIFLAKFFPFSWQIYCIICVFSVVCIAVFLKQKLVPFFLAVAFITGGATLYRIEIEKISPNRLKVLYDSNQFISGEPIEIEGILNGKPELAVGGFFVELRVTRAFYRNEEREVSGKLRLFAAVPSEEIGREYDELQLYYGTKIRVACQIRREEKFQNPGVASFKEIIDQKELDATGFIKSPLLIERIEDTPTFLLTAWLYEQRQSLILEFKNLFSQQTSGVLIASLLNNRYHLDKDTSDRFREGGTFHALVISGMHITFIGTWILFIIQRFTRNRWWQFLLAAAFLWAYSLMVGAEVPVTRAAIMFTILLFARIVFRDANLINALGVSGLFLLIWRPSDVFDQSFQLTFACVIAIVAMAFPILDKMKAIGSWRPTVETPFSPNASKRLKSLCEMLYWRESVWKREAERNIWTCVIFKTPKAELLESKKLQRPLRFLFETLLVSFCVQLWLVPMMVVFFHRISLISLLLNVWIGALTAFFSLTAIIAVLLAKVSTIFAATFVLLTEIVTWITIHAADPLIESGLSSIRLPIYAGNFKLLYVVYFLPLIAFSLLILRWNPLGFISNTAFQIPDLKFRVPNFVPISAFLILFSLIIFHPFSSPKIDGRLHVDFLDVGQGDSALITFPNGETLLVDGGGKPNFSTIYTQRDGEESEPFTPDTRNLGEAVVSEFLWEKGYDKVDYILATHADADHIQGLVDVARNFKIKAAIIGRTPLQDADFVELNNVLQNRNVPTQTVSRGDVLTFGDAKIEILYPENTDEISDNNHSVTFRLIFGERKFFFTGDIEKETENLLVQTPQFLQSEVIKVAHHGSRSSSIASFIELSKAKVAVISVGKESPFGHPHEEVIERWKNSNAQILQTGERGTISFSTNGKDLQFTTFVR